MDGLLLMILYFVYNFFFLKFKIIKISNLRGFFQHPILSESEERQFKK